MAVDLATLAIQIDSSKVPAGVYQLDKLTAAGGRAEKATDALGASWAKTLAGFAAVTGIASGVGLLLKFAGASIEAEGHLAQLTAAVKSTGGAANLTVPELVKMSAEMQKLTTYSDDNVQSMQAILLTFTSIGRDIFPRASMAVANLATRMGGDLNSAAIQVGKALNSPTEGITALTRAGIQFSDTQKATIKAMEDMNNKAGAQAIVLAELDKQFGGAAAAARNTLGGALKGLRNDFDNLFELESGLPELASAVNFVAQNLDKLVAGFNGVVIAAVAYGALKVGQFFVTAAMEAYAHVGALAAVKKANIDTANAELIRVNALVADTVATQAVMVVARAEALAKLNATNATIASTTATIANAKAVGALSGALAIQRDAENALAVTQQRRALILGELALLGQQQARISGAITAAQTAQTAASAALATAQGAVGATGSLLTRALGFLGGPIGVITTLLGLGATAWSLWSSAAKKAEESTTTAIEQSTPEIIANIKAQTEALEKRNALRDKVPVDLRGAGDNNVAALAGITAQIDAVSKAEGVWANEPLANRIEVLKTLGKTYGDLTAAIEANNAAKKRESDLTAGDQLVIWMEKYATASEKATAEITKAKAALGGLFTPELEKRIRASFPDEGIKKVQEFTKEYEALLATISGKASGVDADFGKNLQLLFAGFTKGKATLAEYQKQVELLIKQQPFYATGVENETKLLEEELKAYEKLNRARREEQEAEVDLINNMNEMLDGLQDELKYLGMTNLEREVAVRMRQLESAGLVKGTKEYNEHAAAIRSTLTALQERTGMIDTVNQWGDAFGNFFADLVMNGKDAFSNLWSSAKNFFRQLLAEMGKRYLLNLVANGSSTFGGAASSAAGSALNSMGGSVAGSALNILSGAFGVGGLAGTAGAYGAAIGTTAIGTGSQAAMLASQTAVFGAEGLALTGSAAGGITGSITAALASIPVWGWIAIAAMAAYAAFGGKKGGPKTGGSFQAMFDESGTQTGTNPTNLFGLQPGESTGDDAVKTVATATAKSYYELVRSLGGTARALNFGFGYDSDPKGTADNRIKGTVTDAAGNSIFKEWDRAIGRDSERIGPELQLTASRALLAALQASNLPAEMAKLLGSVTASSATQTELDNLFKTAAVLQQVILMVGKSTITGLSIESLRAMQAEGEELNNTLDRVRNGMLAMASVGKTQAEQFADFEKELAQLFATVGQKAPENIAQWQQMVAGIDLSTQAGRDLFNVMSGVADSFQQAQDAVQGMIDSIWQSAQQANGGSFAALFAEAQLQGSAAAWNALTSPGTSTADTIAAMGSITPGQLQAIIANTRENFGASGVALLQQVWADYASFIGAQNSATNTTTTSIDTLGNAAAAAAERVRDLRQGIADYLTGSLQSALSPLTPDQKLLAAKQAYYDNLPGAMQGNEGAMQRWSGLREALLEAGQAALASSPEYVALYNSTFNDGAGMTGGLTQPLTTNSYNAGNTLVIERMAANAAEARADAVIAREQGERLIAAIINGTLRVEVDEETKTELRSIRREIEASNQ